jgi:hypothetical protein
MLTRLEEHREETNNAIANIQDSLKQMANSLNASQHTPPQASTMPPRAANPSPEITTATAIESLKADIIKELAPQLIGALKEIIGASVQTAVSDAISQKLSPQQLRPTIEQILRDIQPTRVTPTSYPGPSPSEMYHMNHPMYSMPAHSPPRYNHSPPMLSQTSQHPMTYHSPQRTPHQSPDVKKVRSTSPMDETSAGPSRAQRFDESDDAPGENPSSQQ